MLITRPHNYPDSFFIRRLDIFIRRMHCALHQIITNGITPAILISASVRYDRINYRWKSIDQRDMCPSVVLLDGNKSYTNGDNIFTDLEHLFLLPEGCMMDGFYCGYQNNSSYKDYYRTTDYHWSMSAMFNLGRYFFEVARGVKLPFKHHEKIAHLFDSIKVRDDA